MSWSKLTGPQKMNSDAKFNFTSRATLHSWMQAKAKESGYRVTTAHCLRIAKYTESWWREEGRTSFNVGWRTKKQLRDSARRYVKNRMCSGVISFIILNTIGYPIIRFLVDLILDQLFYSNSELREAWN